MSLKSIPYNRQAPEAAKLLRKDLKEKFPGVKFSVKSQTFRGAMGGNEINVIYNDPSVDRREVTKVANRYLRGHWDFSDPYRDYGVFVADNEDETIPQVVYMFVTNINPNDGQPVIINDVVLEHMVKTGKKKTASSYRTRRRGSTVRDGKTNLK